MAALHLFLQRAPDDPGAWAPIGLIQALVVKSVFAGFSLFETSAEIFDSLEDGSEAGREQDNILALKERLEQSGATAKMAQQLGEVPGLTSFLTKKADEAWEKGVGALFTGDLFLGLYSDEELDGAASIFELPGRGGRGPK
ncbi:MAG: hypothetical protein L0332_27195 [Chloroflexi bacterium]|nr:hypothetical protein [Chloroflexota bacterium]MCI0577147.1 hypothetical protein [Chloroflexota bacterium]MCI0644687.1 hypothetical protein [Chloroflexota bacterium]MCI0730385.1 hypothetical protein [Chloroflexota bacterium]